MAEFSSTHCCHLHNHCLGRGKGFLFLIFQYHKKYQKKCPGNCTFLKEARHGEAGINAITVACVLEKMVSILKPLTARPARKPPTQLWIIYLLNYKRKMLAQHPREPWVSLNKTYLRITVGGNRSEAESEPGGAKDRKKCLKSACTPAPGSRPVLRNA